MTIKLVILILIKLVVPLESAFISLCTNYNTTHHPSPHIVLLREHNSEDVRIKGALDDVECWLQKYFNVSESFSVPTRGDKEMMCYKVATVPVKPRQLLVFVGESSAINCSVSIYGPVPNIMSMRVVIDGTREDPTRAIELALRNTGGFFAIQSPVRTPTHISKIRKSMDFLLEINGKTPEYGKLLPFWKPTITVPPVTWQIREGMERNERLEAEGMSISWVLLVNVMPMIVFGSLVSCYIVYRPRGGLTYTDEEIDFTIQEVESNPKVNTIFRIPQFPVVPDTPPQTAIEPEDPLKTAIPREELHVDRTPASPTKSPEEMRLNLVENRTISEDTASLKTGVEVKLDK